jgi:hypothetical protein
MGPDATTAPPATNRVASAPHLDASLDRLRVNIAKTIQRYFQPLFILTIVTAVVLFVIIFVGMYTGSTIATMALAASVQVAFGMIIGYVCVYIGLMMTWFGIDASYSFKGSLDVGGAKSEGALKSASPGLLFALGGMVLIAVSLYKPIVYEEKGGLPAHIGTLSSLGGQAPDDEPIRPNPPPPLPTRNSSSPESP